MFFRSDSKLILLAETFNGYRNGLKYERFVVNWENTNYS